MMHETEKSLDHKQLPYLPEHLIVQNILPRLPVKSLLRFKSVCKSWLSTIPSRKFVESHRKLFSPPTKYLLFLGDEHVQHNLSSRRVVSLSVDSNECSSSRVTELVNFEFKYDNGGVNNVYVVGSSNSLICLHDEKYRFCLWNPATRSNYYISCPVFGFRETVEAVGFGYVSSINDFKIACICSSSDHHASVNLYLYSLSSAKWDKIAGLDHDGRKISRGASSVMIDDTLYWPPVVDRDFTNPVVGVNLVNHQLHRVNLSSDSFHKPVHDRNMVLRLMRIKGRLACCYKAYKDSFAQVWVLMRDGIHWVKLYEIKDEDMNWLYLSENDKSLILKDSHLMLLDPSQIFEKQFEKGTLFDDDGLCISKTLEYKESLLSPEFSS